MNADSRGSEKRTKPIGVDLLFFVSDPRESAFIRG
jgi:hypothetical protein